MATIVTRAGKGTPLTNTELDNNFTNLNTELGSKLVSADLAPYLTSVNAAATYQTLSGMSSYLTTAAAASGYLPLSGGTLAGNLAFDSNSRRITGDFTSATRVLVQTNTANSNTLFGLIPSGTSVDAQFHVWGNSDITNASLGAFTINSAQVQIQSTAAGTGTILPFRVLVGSTEVFRATTGYSFLLGASTDSGYGEKLQVTGQSRFSSASKLPGSGDDGTINAVSSDAMGVDKGGTITLGGMYDGSGITRFAAIAGFKENATSGNYAGYLAFFSRAHNSQLAERGRISGAGNWILGSTTDNATDRLQVAGSVGITTNLNFSGTGNRITGDFSNATVASRAALQSSTANGNTLVNLIPNGTATVSRLGAMNNSTPTNASVVSLGITSTAAEIVSTANGTGTLLPLDIYVGGGKVATFASTGLTVPGTLSSGAHTVTSGGIAVTGNSTVTGTFSAEANAAEVLTFGSTSRKMYGRADTGGVSVFDGPGQTGNGWYFDTANNKVKGFISSTSKFEFSSTGLAVTGQVTTTDNVGIGVTPSAWSSSYKVLDIASGGAAVFGGTSFAGISNNSFVNSSFQEIYKTSNPALQYLQVVGQHRWYTAPSGTAGNAISFTQAMTLDASGNLLPGANGTQAFGSTSLRWSQVWCTAGAFNTSDATLKTPIRTMQSAELAAGYQMAQELGTFQWLESVKEKGDRARRHVGLTVQRAAEIMEAHGLKPWAYGFMGYDKWDAVTEIVDATEDDDGAYPETVTLQKTEKQVSQKQTVEIVDGKPVLSVETVETDAPVTEQIQVVDADGNPVFTDVAEVPAVLDEEGNEVTPAIPAHQVPMLHAVPVMENITVWKRVKEVRPAGESYAFRSDQLAFFITAGVASKVGA